MFEASGRGTSSLRNKVLFGNPSQRRVGTKLKPLPMPPTPPTFKDRTSSPTACRY
jgi:hypothetical protein